MTKKKYPGGDGALSFDHGMSVLTPATEFEVWNNLNRLIGYNYLASSSGDAFYHRLMAELGRNELGISFDEAMERASEIVENPSQRVDEQCMEMVILATVIHKNNKGLDLIKRYVAAVPHSFVTYAIARVALSS